ncbi:uncharacterized protein LAJ45_08871 [Morchella importuna]|uniref:uncharacterized protein n=1 Tax=Morchella importuna TaxID=1174673 RepID=UPI001E8E501B|nr:uncharacterized protein LAJ45_08871 [Morchella importuna]KAH8147072.1 hypothetical protein LAJ45_08871 [Morchella importuna]
MSSATEQRLDDLRENVTDLLHYEIISDRGLKEVLDREDAFEAGTADMMAHIPDALKNDFLDGLIAQRRRGFDKEVLEMCRYFAGCWGLMEQVLENMRRWTRVERGPPRYGENSTAG